MPAPLVAEARALVPAGVDVIAGGETRQETVHLALGQVSSDRVVVHDAARPFASVDLVARLLAALDGAEGAVLGVPVDETVKRVSGTEVVETVDRSDLWRSQTPQAFSTSSLKAAHERASEEEVVVTDDAQLIERYGGRVVMVEGSPRNIKLTRPEDFVVAEAMLGAMS